MTNYKTTDIILASCLKLKGFDLSNIEISGNKGIFCFSEADDKFLQDYDLGKITVEPISFNNTIKQLTTSVRRKINK